MGIRISDLSAATALADGDQIPIGSAAAGDTRRVPASVAKAYFTPAPTADNKVTQYANPALSPFTVTITQASSSVWLIISPTGPMAIGIINLPAAGFAVDRQEVLVCCTQAVTTLAVNATSLGVVGAPTTLAQFASFRMRFDAVSSNWYKVGS